MKKETSRAVRSGWKYTYETYGFLLEKGYEIVSVEEAEMGWRAVLRRAGLFVDILHTRGDGYVSFRTGMQTSDESFDLESVVYTATGEKISTANGSDPARQLQQYLDRIETYFTEEYIKNPDGLRSVQDAAREAAWTAYREMVSRVKPISPQGSTPAKEPKRIAILYYPLMGIVLLLLFMVMTTLYMVMLDRLFAALSWDPDSYTLFMGIGAILLSTATMLLFRRRRQKR